MRLGRVVDFKSDVIGTSRRSGRKSPRLDSDIWRKLPAETCWFSCHIEPCDIEKIFVYAGREWKEAFGTFSLNAVAAANLAEDDQNHHKSRIEHLMHTLASGHKYQSLALMAFSGAGPYVMIDGCHRAAAMLRLGMLAGQSCYVGFHQDVGKDHAWFRHALCGTARSSKGDGSAPHGEWTSAPLALGIGRKHRSRRGHSHDAHSHDDPPQDSERPAGEIPGDRSPTPQMQENESSEAQTSNGQLIGGTAPDLQAEEIHDSSVIDLPAVD
ncbi:MAG TPA: hypothetical protein VGH74_15365 [Planctomycetaceae bacterium]|jgi:hypothetical protein